jgi:hypothetical protein
MNHDMREVLGFAEWLEDRHTLRVKWLPGVHITIEGVWSIFGNCGIRVLRQSEGDVANRLIYEFEILEFSFAPADVRHVDWTHAVTAKSHADEDEDEDDYAKSG